MNVAFDLHGVIDKRPDTYKKLMLWFKCLDHNIYIISGSTYDNALKELIKLDIHCGQHYSSILSVTDNLLKNGFKSHQDENGNLWFDENVWWTEKGNLCSDYEIDIIFDDNEKYEPYMPSKTNFILIK